VLRLFAGAARLVLLAAPGVLAQEGKIAQARDDILRGPEQSGSEPVKKDRSSQRCDDDSGFGDLFGPLVLGAVAAPFVVPVALLDDQYRVDGRFPPCPYYNSQPGYLDLERPPGESHPDGSSTEPDALKIWAVRLSVEESNDFDGLNRLNGQVLLEGPLRLGLQADWSWLHENLSDGGTDDAFLADANLVFRFAQHECVEMRAGLGGRLWADSSHTRGGFNFTYGADVYPVKPLVLSGQFDAGTLGNTGVWHVRATAGLLFRGLEAYVGYDFLQIGSANFQGPVLGLRLWF
jgi:hypothetical protein